MALTERIVEDVRVLDEDNFRQIEHRRTTIIERDGVEISRSHHREVLTPDADVSERSTFARAVANAVWTPEIKERWQNRRRPEGPPTDRTEPPTRPAPT